MSEDFLQTAPIKINNSTLYERLGEAISIGFDYQMWCFGCDIKRKEGNLLLDFGFRKEFPAAIELGSSRYSLHIEECGCLYLWGFAALLLCSADCLCLKRYEKSPRYGNSNSSPFVCWRPNDLPQLSFPKDHNQCDRATELLSRIAQLFLSYEEYVLKVTPPSYRKRCLVSKPKGTVPLRKLGMEPIDLWRTLASPT